jgi:hypothetical protein
MPDRNDRNSWRVDKSSLFKLRDFVNEWDAIDGALAAVMSQARSVVLASGARKTLVKANAQSKLFFIIDQN